MEKQPYILDKLITDKFKEFEFFLNILRESPVNHLW